MADNALEVRGREGVLPRVEPGAAPFDEPPRDLVGERALGPEGGIELRVGKGVGGVGHRTGRY